MCVVKNYLQRETLVGNFLKIFRRGLEKHWQKCNIPSSGIFVLVFGKIPETKAEEEAVNIPILSCVREPYPPATTLTVEDIIDITAKKNDILSKSEKQKSHSKLLQSIIFAEYLYRI